MSQIPEHHAHAAHGARGELGVKIGQWQAGKLLCTLSRLSTITPYVVGSGLVVAACLKAHQFLTESLPGEDLFSAPWFRMGVIEVELTLGLALCAGWRRWLMRKACQMLFGAFLAVSLFKTAFGAKSCGCLGIVETEPLTMVIVDAAVLISLWRWRPVSMTTASSRYAVAFVCGPVLVLLIALVFLTTGSTAPHLRVSPPVTDLGRLYQGQRRRFVLELHNGQPYAIMISRLEASCPCLGAQDTPMIVAPGEKLSLPLDLDLAKEPGFSGDLLIILKGWGPLSEQLFMAEVAVGVVAASED